MKVKIKLNNKVIKILNSLKNNPKESYSVLLDRMADKYKDRDFLLRTSDILSNPRLLREIADSMEYYQRVMSN